MALWCTRRIRVRVRRVDVTVLGSNRGSEGGHGGGDAAPTAFTTVGEQSTDKDERYGQLAIVLILNTYNAMTQSTTKSYIPVISFFFSFVVFIVPSS